MADTGDDDDRFKALFEGRPGSVLGDQRSKLTETKEQWARDKRQPQTRRRDGGGRLPPGQHLAKDWPVLDLGQ
ncbi:MAG TPA: sulfite oxidase-like oxidoreductase, partial [Rhodospirillaceae bacterium]|nr:sulfite oxidase-like oxidoreductase [Rhodospirillaceae bacterium]